MAVARIAYYRTMPRSKRTIKTVETLRYPANGEKTDEDDH